MKLPNLLSRKKKLRASAARRSIALPDDMEFEEMSEPNMKLSRALLIVLVLHVVAVAGIIAFNTIKTHQAPTATTAAKSLPSPAPVPSASATASPASSPLVRRAEPARPTHSSEKIVAKIPPKAEPVKPVEKAVAVGKTYVVAKGDTPLSVARKFHVPFDDLMAVNHIEHPHKLKIGQKLVIPTKPAPKKIQAAQR
jgi:LysM repeat protein